MLREQQEGREYIALMNKVVEIADLTSFKINASKYSCLLRIHEELP